MIRPGPSGSPSNCADTTAATPKAATMAATATPPETDFGSRRPRKALIRNPMNGRSGISASSGMPSPLQRREHVGAERFFVAEQGDHNRQSDRRLGGRHGHHEEGDDLPFDRAKIAARGDERE